MDELRFDHLTRVVSDSSRRSLLSAIGTALLAALLHPIAGEETLAKRKGQGKKQKTKPQQERQRKGQEKARQERHHQDDARKKTKKRRGGASAQGPCGDGSGKANACKRDGQCCTGHCDKKKGRCRCKKLGESCTQTRNCCANVGQPMTCQNGACQAVDQDPASPSPPPPPPPPSPCVGQCAPTMACGDDSCGGSCGSCAANETCPSGSCVCVGDCTGKTCGDDGCGGSCGDCDAPNSCLGGACGCVPQCAGKECGPDGCGNQCGFCSGPICHDVTCTAAGLCAVSPIAGCCSVAGDCAMNNPCMTDRCQSGMCQQDPVAPGAPCTQSSGSDGLCNADGHCMECLSDGDCDDGNACTTNTCRNGVCQYPALGAGASCPRGGGGAGFCDGAGQCVQCLSEAQCGDGNPCHIPRCEPNSHTCAFAMAENYTNCGGTNHCLNGDCRACIAASGLCLRNAQCCDFYTQTGVCTNDITDVPLLGLCCRRNGESCQTDLACCRQKCYRTQSGSGGFGTCVDRGCRDDGQTCIDHPNCCSNNCRGGICRPPGQ